MVEQFNVGIEGWGTKEEVTLEEGGVGRNLKACDEWERLI